MVHKRVNSMKLNTEPYTSSPPLAAASSKLSDFEIFKDFSKDELARIQKNSVLQTFQRRAMLFKEGEPLNNIFFLLKGHVKLCKKESLDREIIFSLLGENYVFEMMIADQLKNHAFSAYALSDSTVFIVSTPDFRKYFMGNFGFANRLLYQKMQTIRIHCDFQLTAGKPVEVRMAHFILGTLKRSGMASRKGKIVRLEFPLTRKEIAELANTTVETSIRVMGKWIKRGLITMDRQYLVIRDINAFKKIIGKIPLLSD